jgi:hypothetical protein
MLSQMVHHKQPDVNNELLELLSAKDVVAMMSSNLYTNDHLLAKHRAGRALGRSAEGSCASVEKADAHFAAERRTSWNSRTIEPSWCL